MIKNYSDIKFDQDENGFRHNLEADYACIALWKSAKPFREEIRNLLESRFEILAETEVEWSEEHFHDNAARLYEAPLFWNIAKEKRQSNQVGKIGDRNFILFVVKDINPDYSYAKSVSQVIELSNLNIVKTKYEIRDRIKAKSGSLYAVHSTNNIYEFFVQAPLLLGMDIYNKMMNGEKYIGGLLKKDLEGADGWTDYQQVFKMLNLTSNYLVQRSFETLPYKNEEKDIDLLTDNYQRLASVLGVLQSPTHPYKGYMYVGSEKISVDMRFVGDKYYNPTWQKDMLSSKKLRDGVFVPRDDFYFFSLLFHCKVQKKSVKEKYYGILDSLAKKLKFQWFSIEQLADDKAVGMMLKGYFKSYGYYYEDPVDRAVIKNENVIKYLPSQSSTIAGNTLIRRMRAKMIRLLPNNAKTILLKLREKL